MNYPKHLHTHEITHFLAENFINNTISTAYYHPLSDDPCSASLPYLTSLPMHSHDFYEINIIISGNAMHYLENHIFPAPHGTVFVIPPSIKHGYYSEIPTDIFHLLLNTQFIYSNISTLRSLDGYGFLFDVEPMLRRNTTLEAFLHLSENELNCLLPQFNRLIQYRDMETPNKYAMQKFTTLNIIAELCSLVKNTAHNENKYHADAYISEMLEIIDYINSNYNKNVDFHKLADKYSLSYPTFYRHFKKLFKMSPNQYQTHRRIEEASKMLSNGETSLTSIAQECGFYDAAHFSRTFKEKYGNSPKTFMNIPED